MSIGYLIALMGFVVNATSMNSAFIKDVEGLLHAVDSRDASRPQLTLKLADALFNEALAFMGQVKRTETEQRQMVSHQRQALQLYSDALSGYQGLFPIPAAQARGKIEFQMARLHFDLGELAEAQKIWQNLSKQDSMPDVQRESLLRQAELLENRSRTVDVQLAESYYRKALTLCSGQDVCSYIHFRLAWVYERQMNTQAAVNEMTLALWDAKGQVREEALRDLISFMGELPGDGQESLTKIENLSVKLARPQLISELADAYFSRGNRGAGVNVLTAANRKTPTLKSYIRLFEEEYGFRNWGKLDADLNAAFKLSEQGTDVSQDLESEKVLRRLTVQLDGERSSRPASAETFKKTVLLYLTLYPARRERRQMMDGWLAAETDPESKMKQLQLWISQEHKAARKGEEMDLRKIRASLAQSVGNFVQVASEMRALANLTDDPRQKREHLYRLAFAQYKNRDLNPALEGFRQLAQVPPAGDPDTWAVQSQHLALDILAQEKDYIGVLKQAQYWTADPRYSGWVARSREHKDELNDLKKVAGAAQFEWASSLGADPRALDIFYTKCMQDLLLPQSCNNAKVLAVQLSSQKILIEVLQKLGLNEEVASELEASARFTEAARTLEPKLKNINSTPPDFLKVALLYELGSGLVNRDRVLRQMLSQWPKQKTMGPEEDLILQTLIDADLIGVSSLKLPWKAVNQERLMDELVARKLAPPTVQAQLIKLCRDTGPGWRASTLKVLNDLASKQSRIRFIGHNSQRKFQVRVQALRQLTERGNCYMQATSAEQRVKIAQLLAANEKDLANEIKASPLPDDVNDETKASLERALTEMAQPFFDKAEEYNRLATAQAEKIPAVQALNPSQTKQVVIRDPAESSAVLNAALTELHANPKQPAILDQIKNYYETSGNPRLAAYYQGRILQLANPPHSKEVQQ